jgi:hypothetical protein
MTPSSSSNETGVEIARRADIGLSRRCHANVILNLGLLVRRLAAIVLESLLNPRPNKGESKKFSVFIIC